MLSDDNDFDDIAISKGDRIVYPTRWTDPIYAYDFTKKYGDFHPDVESPLKTICYNEGTTQQFVLSSPKTTLQLFNAYYICWHLSHVLRIITRNRKLLQEKDTIIANSDDLPEHLTVVKLPTACDGMEYGISCGDAEFFSDRKYKVCVWDN